MKEAFPRTLHLYTGGELKMIISAISHEEVERFAEEFETVEVYGKPNGKAEYLYTYPDPATLKKRKRAKKVDASPVKNSVPVRTDHFYDGWGHK